MTMPCETLRKIALIIPRLGSNHDGEIVATARAIQRTLAAEGSDWHALADVIREPAVAVPQKYIITQYQPPLDPAHWLAHKFRLTPHRARLIAELMGWPTPDHHVSTLSKPEARR